MLKTRIDAEFVLLVAACLHVLNDRVKQGFRQESLPHVPTKKSNGYLIATRPQGEC
ncbi:MAG: hypothetical protein ACI3Z5_03950 [Paludibacteraceae bacterium]